jgi:hypothetical protein
MKIKVKTFDVETGEESIFEREETAQELQERLNAENAYAARQAEAKAKAEAKAAAQAKLTALGLTVDDLQALGL